jgi:hypothetical protein
VGQARNSLKLGSTIPRLNQEPLSLLTLHAERQKKTVNLALKDYGRSLRVEEQTLGIPHENIDPGPGELHVE